MQPSSLFSVYLMLFLLIIIWALSWPVSKIALQYIPPLWFTFYRILVAVIALFLFLVFKKNLRFPKRTDLWLIMSLGLLQIGLFLLLITLGLHYISAQRAVILAYTTPIWVTPVAIIGFHEKLSRLKMIGFVLGISGIAILFTPWSFNWQDKNVLIGSGILVLASVSWAISILIARYSRWYSTPLDLIIWQLLVAMLSVGAITLIFEPHPYILWNKNLIICILFNGIFSTALGYWCVITVSKALPSITTSLAFLGVPVLGLILSQLILHETLTVSLLIALCSIITGMCCLFLAKR